MADVSKVKAVQLEIDAPSGRRKRLMWLIVPALALMTICAVAVSTAIILSSKQKRSPAWAQKNGYIKFPHDYDELDHPTFCSDDGRYVEQSVTIPYDDGEGGTSLELTYNATIIEDYDERVLALDYDESVMDVLCADGVLTIQWASAADAQAQEHKIAQAIPKGALITGSAEWGCSRFALGEVNESDYNTTIQHHVVEIVEVINNELSLRLAPAAFNDFFEELHIECRTFGAPSNESDESAGEASADDDIVYTDFDDLVDVHDDPDYGNTTTAPESRRELLVGSLYNLGRRVVGTTVREVVRAPRRVRQAANFVRNGLTGDFRLGSANKRSLLRWSWQGRDYRRNGRGIDMRQARASLNLGVLFNIHISRWRLQSAQLAARGSASLTAAGRIVANNRWNHQHVISILDNRGLGSVTFMVAMVPFRIEAQLDLDAVLDVGAQGSLDVSAGMTASATAQLGVAFRSGRWVTENNRNWNRNRVLPSVDAQASAELGVTLVPTVQLTANWIGGPTLAVIPYMVANVDVNAFRSPRCTSGVGFGVDVTVGARLDVQNPVTGRSLGCSGCTRTLGTATVFKSSTDATTVPCSFWNSIIG